MHGANLMNMMILSTRRYIVLQMPHVRKSDANACDPKPSSQDICNEHCPGGKRKYMKALLEGSLNQEEDANSNGERRAPVNAGEKEALVRREGIGNVLHRE